MPGNVEYGSKEIPGMRVFDMDDLQEYVQKTPAPELLNISQAEKIVNEELVEYQKLLRIIPFIGELHKKIEQIRQREVERMMRNLHDPQPEIIEQLELFSHSLVRKILHEPTMHLRNETDQATLNEYVDALAKLYDLTEKTGSEL
jgi:glutamyl-tRNA reductase